jgi:hypothetical protein
MPTAKAGAQCRVPVPSPPRHHGGKLGVWGQARLVGAGEANGGHKPSGQIPSQQNVRSSLRYQVHNGTRGVIIWKADDVEIVHDAGGVL